MESYQPKSGFLQNAKKTNEEYESMQDVVWICAYCSNQQKEVPIQGENVQKYAFDIICTVLGDQVKIYNFLTQVCN